MVRVKGREGMSCPLPVLYGWWGPMGGVCIIVMLCGSTSLWCCCGGNLQSPSKVTRFGAD